MSTEAKNSISFNQLKDEKSAYLLQHKDNPVHWWSYGPLAIQKAKNEDKPIFLSVGYSSCHWCHIMAHESFENQETAQFLNEHFICIKVDREEYPDLDHYYQQACQLFIQTGGWPLSAFLLPDLRPFFVGTYYPKSRREEGITFMELIRELERAYREERTQVEENATKVTSALRDNLASHKKIDYPNHFPAPQAILQAISEYADQENGGFGKAPKFPHFSFYEFALEQMLEGMISEESGQHIIKSLENMLLGGLVDHARGGIHRYSTDNQFLIPHFEKMLYDQAGFLRVLAKLSLLSPGPLVYDTLVNTLEYLSTEMLSEKGYLFSAQDADSEGQEGLYFTYTEEEFESVVNKASNEEDHLTLRMEEIKSWFQITKKGNFENGLNVISLNPQKKHDIITPDSWEIIRRIRRTLLENRKARIPPATDNKGVASWNFQIVSALVDVMQYCRIDLMRKMASDLFNKTVEGLYRNFLVNQESSGMQIRHSTTLKTSLPYLEDYTTFAEAQLRIYEVTANPLFKDNLKDTLNFIFKEFVSEEGKLFTRTCSTDDHYLYPNEEATSFDSSFKSAASTLIGVMRRARALFRDPKMGSKLKEAHEKLKNHSLRNPLNAGEALRSSVYPDQAYRVIKIPAIWLEKAEFIGFFNSLLPRFVLDYHWEKEEIWEICTTEQCELNGIGLANFIETLRPKDA